jgi:hypothetical protein
MASFDRHAQKAAKNEALMREVNERIEEVAEEAERPDFLCECANPDCIETLTLSLDEYEAIRSSPVRFAVAPGHDFPEIERIVKEGGYVVVEKIGEAARIVETLDPRSR